MAKSSYARMMTLIKRYQYFLWAGALVFFSCIGASLYIYYTLNSIEETQQPYWTKLADFLMDVGQTMLGTVLIGGGLGGIFNFIVEEQKKEEEAIRERLKSMHESRDKRREFRLGIKQRLQDVHDDVELARLLIRSHRSGRTYGEQIRTRIMPSHVALNDIKRQLIENSDEGLVTHAAELQVSLTYMSAYLGTLIEEFAHNYLEIANIQNYQDAVSVRMHAVFTEVVEQTDPSSGKEKVSTPLLEAPTDCLEQQDMPERIEVVWQAMERLDYVWDFIDDLRDTKGKASLFQRFYIDHHFHCFKMLRPKDSKTSKKVCNRLGFQGYLKRLEELTAKKESDQPITKHDSLTRIIMVEGLKFDFEAVKMAE